LCVIWINTKLDINLENVHFVGLYYIIMLQCTVQKNIKLLPILYIYTLYLYVSAHRALTYGGVGVTVFILHIGTKWGRMVKFTPRPLYLQGKSARYSLSWRLHGPQNRSGLHEEEQRKTL